MTDDLWKLSAVDMRKGLDAKDFSAVEVMTSVIGRTHTTNPKLNAVVYDYSDKAIAKAERADEALARGEHWGPLHGIPTTIKVNVDYEGTPNTNGLPALANNIAPGNSPVVQNLLNAGAIIFGKTNTPGTLHAGDDRQPRCTAGPRTRGMTAPRPAVRLVGRVRPVPRAWGRSIMAMILPAHCVFRRPPVAWRR